MRVGQLSQADQDYVGLVQLVPAAIVAKHVIVGEVVGITDGDTLTVLDRDKKSHKIRLSGIDTPEKTQAYGTEARKALAAKVFRKQVRVAWDERGKYGRIIGDVYLDDRWINKAMVEEGWAWHYRQYSDSEELAAAEATARSGGARIWSDPHVVAPWTFAATRRLSRSESRRSLLRRNGKQRPPGLPRIPRRGR